MKACTDGIKHSEGEEERIGIIISTKLSIKCSPPIRKIPPEPGISTQCTRKIQEQKRRKE